MLFDDIRMEESELQKLDMEKIVFLSERYHSTNIRKLVTILKRMQHEYGN